MTFEWSMLVGRKDHECSMSIRRLSEINAKERFWRVETLRVLIDLHGITGGCFESDEFIVAYSPPCSAAVPRWRAWALWEVRCAVEVMCRAVDTLDCKGHEATVSQRLRTPNALDPTSERQGGGVGSHTLQRAGDSCMRPRSPGSRA